ncbi:fungal-specific transcription factor domain-containing protein [Mycena epipterygia]|nr:fungal-specific transcription factor domain-containing protein [Mycena epipterygia]
MSSNDEDPYENEAGSKSKRVQRACDMCRRKKRRCDGAERCDHCVRHNFVCTYIEPTPRLVGAAASIPDVSVASTSTPSPSKSYIEALETRLKTVEAILEKKRNEKSPGVQLLSNAIAQLNSPYPPPHSDDLTFADIDESFRALSIDNTAAQGFQGKSSGAMLVKAAVDLKNGTKNAYAPEPIPSTIKSWEALESPPPPIYSFPEDDLLDSLVSLYFSNVNKFLPLLHRPTFESGVRQQFHLIHAGFAKTLLLVCAVGARYSTDPRVAIPETPPAETAGWKWFDQVELSGHLVRAHPTLYDLQSYCLAGEFLDCTSSPRTCWTLIGFGMRLAQDIGSHRFRLRGRALTFEEELEKRASWVLFLIDTQMSTALGRCIVLQSHDFDIEMPIICDDEYWGGDLHTPMFTQPAGKPSVMAFFNCMLHLARILSFSCKILYSTNRSKILIGLGDDKWEEQVVVELDSALNKWFETIPSHLRWDPDNLISDAIFFDQSAVLYCAYYHTRIIIHRPFIPAMRRASNPTHPLSLAICNTAARACSHVAQIQQQRRQNNPLWFSQTPLFTSGIVLLLNIWGGSGGSMGRLNAAEKDLDDVYRCMAVLDAQRRQWPSAGALLDTLRQLVAADHPLGSVHASNSPRASPPAAPYTGETAAPDLSFSTPFPVPLSPPMYDPQLETAPQDHLADDSWYDPIAMNHPNPHAFGFAGDAQTYLPSNYVPPDLGFTAAGPSTLHGQDFAGEDFNMIDANTIALWSRAPPSFGVADWDTYLGQFVDQTSPQPDPNAQY